MWAKTTSASQLRAPDFGPAFSSDWSPHLLSRRQAGCGRAFGARGLIREGLFAPRAAPGAGLPRRRFQSDPLPNVPAATRPRGSPLRQQPRPPPPPRRSPPTPEPGAHRPAPPAPTGPRRFAAWRQNRGQSARPPGRGAHDPASSFRAERVGPPHRRVGLPGAHHHLDAHLTIGRFADGPAVLLLDTDGLTVLLEPASFLDNPGLHRRQMGQGLLAQGRPDPAGSHGLPANRCVRGCGSTASRAAIGSTDWRCRATAGR